MTDDQISKIGISHSGALMCIQGRLGFTDNYIQFNKIKCIIKTILTRFLYIVYSRVLP